MHWALDQNRPITYHFEIRGLTMEAHALEHRKKVKEKVIRNAPKISNLENWPNRIITFCPSTSRPLEPFEVKACWLHYLHQFMFQATKGIPPRYTQSIRECPLNLPNKSTTTHLTQLHLMQHITYHNKTKRPKSLLFIITSKKEEPNGTESCPTMLGQHLL